MKESVDLFVESLVAQEVIHKTSSVLAWVDELNSTVSVEIRQTTLDKTGWFYDVKSGQITNEKRAFFQISGISQGLGRDATKQPIILQNEIGFLGILCKVFDGVLYMLVQAKIEPGNINKIQLSPTIQATKSNFMQAHGGARPKFFEYFAGASKHHVVVDQIQSEQSSRFLGKRNRNIIVLVDNDVHVEETKFHRWLTLAQIKELLAIDNLVNMDTRTVISCIPFHLCDDPEVFGSVKDAALIKSMTQGVQPDAAKRIYQHLNDYKMFQAPEKSLIPLYSLKDWEVSSKDGVEEFVHTDKWPFKVIYCNISIDGREVKSWGQPLFMATGIGVLGLLTRVRGGMREFLVRCTPEIGCFDHIELGPSVQIEPNCKHTGDAVSEFFKRHLEAREGVLYDVVLSEEGGRFYHEQNRNVIAEIGESELSEPPNGYFWLTYRTICEFIQVNNCVNIQLRNLIALLRP